MPEIDHADLYMFLVSSGRYAWNRSTYIVESTADAVKKYAKHLQTGELEVIQRDLREAQKEWQKTEEKTELRQHTCDKKTMSDLDSWLAAEINRRNLGHGDEDDL